MFPKREHGFQNPEREVLKICVKGLARLGGSPKRKIKKEATQMGVPEILVIIGASAIVLGVIISSIVKKAKGKGGCGGDCSSCGSCPYCHSKETKKK